MEENRIDDDFFVNICVTPTILLFFLDVRETVINYAKYETPIFFSIQLMLTFLLNREKIFLYETEKFDTT